MQGLHSGGDNVCANAPPCGGNVNANQGGNEEAVPGTLGDATLAVGARTSLLKNTIKAHSAITGAKDLDIEGIIALVNVGQYCAENKLSPDQATTQTGLPSAIAEPLLGFLATGGPPSVGYVTACIFDSMTVQQNVSLLTPAAPSTQSALAGSPGVHHADARETVCAAPPPFWIASPASLGEAAMPLPPWSTFALTAPIDNTGLKAHPLPTADRLGKILQECSQTPALWTVQRNSLLEGLGARYAFNLGSSILSGAISVKKSIEAATTEAFSYILKAAASVSIFTADALAAQRATCPVAESFMTLILAIDTRFAPRDASTMAAWMACAPGAGATAIQYLDTLRTLAGAQGRDPHQIFDRLKSALIVLENDPGSRQAALLLGSKLQGLTSANFVGVARTDPLFQTVLVPAAKPAPPPLVPRVMPSEGDGSGLTLATRGQMRPAVNLVILLQSARDTKVADIAVPPSGPHELCPLCLFFGVHADTAYDPTLVGKLPAGKRFRHNPWRCPHADLLADKVIAANPSLKKNELLVHVENPAALAPSA